MSTNTVESVAIPSLAEESPLVSGTPRAAANPPALSVFAPVVAACAALLITLLVPNGEAPPKTWMDDLSAWAHPYPILLEALGVFFLLLSPAQWAWTSLRPWVRHYAPLFAGALSLLCVIDLLTAKTGWMPQPYFPGPDQILGGLIDDTIRPAGITLLNGGTLYEAWNKIWTDKGNLLVGTMYSIRLLAFGYLSGVAMGTVTGVLIGWSPRIRYWAVPLMKVIGPVPATALVPLVITVFQGSSLAGAGMIAFAVWFPMTMLTSSGMANVRLSYLDVARTLGAGRLYLIFRVAIPSALPHIFVGLFVGLLTSFLTLVVAETVGVPAGLGWYLNWRKGYMDYPKMYAAVVIMGVVFSAILTLLFKLRDRVLSWQKGVIKW